MWGSVLIAGVLGAIGGGLGAVLGTLFDRRFRREKPAGRISGRMVGAAACAAIAAQPLFVEPLAERFYPISQFERLGREVLALPAMKERLRGKTAAESEALIAHLKQHLTGYKVPRYIVFRTEPLPKSNIGKVLRRVVRDEEGLVVQGY